jgi:hypothetical protein
MRAVLDSSSFARVLTLPCRNCLHSPSNVTAVRFSCCDIVLYAYRKPLFINKLYNTYVCNTNITLCIAFGIIRGFTYQWCWNVLPVVTRALLYLSVAK